MNELLNVVTSMGKRSAATNAAVKIAVVVGVCVVASFGIDLQVGG